MGLVNHAIELSAKNPVVVKNLIRYISCEVFTIKRRLNPVLSL